MKYFELPRLTRRRFLQSASVASTIALIPRSTPAQLNPAVQPTSTVVPALDMIAFNRLGYGPRTGDAEKWNHLGKTSASRLTNWLENQLHPQAINDKACDERVAALKLTTLNKSMEQLWTDHSASLEKMKAEPAAGEKSKKDENKIRLLPASEVELATWTRAVYSEKQLLEVMVGFWHNHFSVFAWEQKIAPGFVQYDRDVIRKHAFGNFREMLEAVAQSPAMLLYLDNGINQSGNPNENYARELFELHTLGAENYLGTLERGEVKKIAGESIGYVDGDVYEAARCFTGWRLDQGANSGNTGTFQYYEPWHDRFQKVVLGTSLKEYQSPLKDGRDVLDILSKHPGTGRYLARKLCRKFVADEPSEGLVEKIAKVFLAQAHSPEQIKMVLRAIVASDEFKSTWGTKIKRPFEATVGFLRAMNADFTPSENFLKNYENAGQRLFSWRTPDGFPDKREKWMGTNTFIEHWRLTQLILLGKIDGVSVDEGKVLLGGGNDPKKFVNHISQTLMNRKLVESSEKQILAFLNRNAKRPRRYIFATGLLMMTPEMLWS